jgi:hypothetical protein
MKKIIVLSIIVLSLAATFSACTTYDEGPGFTILPAETRLKGTWDQISISIGNQLQEENTIGVEFTFNSDGTGIETYTYPVFGSNNNDIIWELNDDKTKILYKDSDANEDTVWNEATILRLTNSEMWLHLEGQLLGDWEVRYEKV